MEQNIYAHMIINVKECAEIHLTIESSPQSSVVNLTQTA